MNKKMIFLCLSCCAVLTSCNKEEKVITQHVPITEYQLRLLGKGTNNKPLTVMNEVEIRMEEEEKAKMINNPLTTAEKLHIIIEN